MFDQLLICVKEEWMELDMIRFSISAVTAAGLLLKKSNSKESVKNIRLSMVIVQALS